MVRQMVLAVALSGVLAGAGAPAFAQAGAGSGGQTQSTQRAQQQTQQRIYGSQLMTQQERLEYRNKMRSMKTAQERQAFRLEHHKLMQERARERGIQLPDMAPMQGKGTGQGKGNNR